MIARLITHRRSLSALILPGSVFHQKFPVMRSLRSFMLLIAVAVGGSAVPGAALAESLSGREIAFFENRIRPVLVKHCYECHAADSEELGGNLRLDTRAGMLRGGQSGPVVVEGDPDKSLIIQALRYDGIEMPPEKPLPEPVVNDFVRWVKRGALDPRRGDASDDGDGRSDGKVSADTGNTAASLWSLQPIQNPPLPEVKDGTWPRHPLDRFVLAHLESEGLTPASDADSRILIRRLYAVLIGLPPTLEQVEKFSADHRKEGAVAVERLVDHLLSRRQYGERWARHWLDVARYGESNGNDGLSRNPTFPHAWRYRDYVIDAFNNDMPFDRFVTEQIAGDLLPADSPEQRDRQLIATGFLAMGAKPAKAMNSNFAMDVVADQIDVVSRGIMGLSVACARCHDHKFDPIPTRDYYALAGIFTSTETMWGLAANEKLTAPKTDLHVLQAAAHVPPPEDFVETVLVRQSNTGKPKPVPKPPWKPGTPLAMGVRDKKKPADCKINIKGNAKKLGQPVPRGFLSACQRGEDSPIKIDPKQSGRVQLAEWLTSESHPLTSRVIVNRVWLHLFGEGIVRSPDDFGIYGERPTHPRLLDHLAKRFVRQGWSIKQLIRDIVLSRTWQLSSRGRPEGLKGDAQNRLLSRHNRRRLDAEALRDSMLHASGQLDLEPGEGSIIRHRDILVNLADSLHQPSNKRSVYLCYLRNSPPPELAAFDLPDFRSVTGQRNESTIPAQALHLYNSPCVVEQSGHFARLVMAATENDDVRVRLAFERAFQREPDPNEQRQALKLVRLTKAELESEEKAWASLCQALLASNEFRYID